MRAFNGFGFVRKGLRRPIWFPLMAVLLLFSFQAALAGIIVDDFSTAQPRITATAAFGSIPPNAPVGPVSGTASTAGTDIIGGTRYLEVTLTQASPDFGVNAEVFGGDYYNAFDADAAGKVRIVWPGSTDPTALSLGANLCAGTKFKVIFGYNDPTMTYRLRVFTDASNWSEFAQVVPGLIVPSDPEVTRTFLMPFSSFVAGAGSGADFCNVGRIELLWDTGAENQPALDMSLQQIEIVDGGASLQGAIDNITVAPNPGVSSTNVLTDELGDTLDSYWAIHGSGGSVSTLVIEISQWANTNTFGIYDAFNPMSKVLIFGGGAGAGSQALFSILGDGSVFVDFKDTGVDFAGNRFGYYLDSTQAPQPWTGGIWYSDTSLNVDQADHMVAYQGKGIDTVQILPNATSLWDTDEYILAFEDLHSMHWGDGNGINDGFPEWSDTEPDFSDFVIMVESVDPAPVAEPRICDPRTQGFWKRICDGATDIKKPHPETPEGFDTTLCEYLQIKGKRRSEPCVRALAQNAALLLNIQNGYLSDWCEVVDFEGNLMTVAEATQEVQGLIESGQCKEAADLAEFVNSGDALFDG